MGDALRGGTGGGAVVAMRRATMGDECGETRGDRLHDLLPSAVSLRGERARACRDEVHVLGSYNQNRHNSMHSDASSNVELGATVTPCPPLCKHCKLNCSSMHWRIQTCKTRHGKKMICLLSSMAHYEQVETKTRTGTFPVNNLSGTYSLRSATYTELRNNVEVTVWSAQKLCRLL